MKKLFILGFLLVCNNQIINSQIVRLEHIGFTIFYDTAQKHAIFSEYILSKSSSRKKEKRHSNKFDPLISSASQNGSNKYINTINLDIGHLIPFKDFSNNTAPGTSVNIWSNMVLQNSGLNRGVWASLEDYISITFSGYNDKKNIIVGADYSTKKINGQFVPNLFWKICIYKKDTLYWEFPNEKPKNKDFNVYLASPFALANRLVYINNIKILSK